MSNIINLIIDNDNKSKINTTTKLYIDNNINFVIIKKNIINKRHYQSKINTLYLESDDDLFFHSLIWVYKQKKYDYVYFNYLNNTQKLPLIVNLDYYGIDEKINNKIKCPEKDFILSLKSVKIILKNKSYYFKKNSIGETYAVSKILKNYNIKYQNINSLIKNNDDLKNIKINNNLIFKKNKNLIIKQNDIISSNINKENNIISSNINKENNIISSNINKNYNFIIYTQPCGLLIGLSLAKMLKKINIKSNITLEITEEIINNNNNNDNEFFIILFPQTLKLFPKEGKYYIYQLEQVKQSKWVDDIYLDRMRKSIACWDYSLSNYDYFDMDIKQKLFYLPMPILTKLNPLNKLLIQYDILFVGEVNNRRKKILNFLSKKYKILTINYTCFNYDLYKEVSKCKLVLNIHFYKNAVLETCRINEMLINNRLVISELPNNEDTYNKNFYEDNIIFFDEINDNLSNIMQLCDKLDYYLNGNNYIYDKKKNMRIIKKIYNNSFYFFNKSLNSILNINNNLTENEIINKKYLLDNCEYIKNIAIITYNSKNTEMNKENYYVDWINFTSKNDLDVINNNIKNKYLSEELKKYVDYDDYEVIENFYYKFLAGKMDVLKKYKYLVWLDNNIVIDNNIDIDDDFITKIINFINNNKEKKINLFDNINLEGHSVVENLDIISTHELLYKNIMIYEKNDNLNKLLLDYWTQLENNYSYNLILKNNSLISTEKKNLIIIASHIYSEIKHNVLMNNCNYFINRNYDIYLIDSLEFKDKYNYNNNFKKIFFVKNDKFSDFGKWFFILNNINYNKYDNIIFTNDSYILINNIDTYLSNVTNNNIEYYGYTDNYEISYHYQSYIFSLNKNSINTLLNLIINKKSLINNYNDVVINYEVDLINLFKNVDCYLKNTNPLKNNIFFHNDTLYKELLNNYKLPIIKLKRVSTDLIMDKEQNKIIINNTSKVPKFITEIMDKIIFSNNIFLKYENLFHKYLLNLRNPNRNINDSYVIIKEFIITKKNILHIHCFDLNKFEKLFNKYLIILLPYFDIIVTYFIINEEVISKNNFTFLNSNNHGIDIGPRFMIYDYLKNKNYKIDYIFFVHSKSDEKKRELYFSFFINNLDKIMYNIDNKIYYAFFPSIILYGEKGLEINNNNIIFKKCCDWGKNYLYMKDIIDYLDLNEYDNKIFTEGNFFILSTELIDKLYSDKFLFNILNTKDSFDYSWFKNFYKFKLNYKESYINYKKNNLFGNNLETNLGWKGLADCMIEHAFERIPIIACNKYKFDYDILDMNETIKKKIKDFYSINYIKHNTITIIACHTNSELKIKTLLHNLKYFINTSSEIIIINSLEFKDLNIENKIYELYKDETLQKGFFYKKIKYYRDNNPDINHLTDEELEEHYLNHGFYEGRKFIKNNFVLIKFEYIENNSLTNYGKLIHAADIFPNNIRKYNNIILANDSYLIVNSLNNFLKLFKYNVELTALLKSYEVKEHYPDFLIRCNNDGFNKLIDFYKNNTKNILNYHNANYTIELEYYNLFSKINYLFDSGDFTANIHFNDKVNEDFLINKKYPVIKLKKLITTIYNNNILPIDFNSSEYNSLHNDLSHLTTEELKDHFITYGIDEGRLYKKNQEIIIMPYIVNIIKEIFPNYDIKNKNFI